MSIQLTVIVPCYNEASRLEPIFELIRENLDRDWEWLFVDDGSVDDTVERLEHFCGAHKEKTRVVRLPRNCGKGRAVREGFDNARGRLVGFVDADLSASPLLFERYLADPELAAGERMIVGIRVKTQDRRVVRSGLRHLIGRGFQTYASSVTGLKAYDTQCGFKLLSTQLAQELSKQMISEGFASDVELILLADLKGVHIDEVMIPWVEKGQSKIRPGHILHMAYDILRIRRSVASVARLQAAPRRRC